MWNQLHRDVEQAGSGVWSVILGLCQAQGYFVCGCVCVCVDHRSSCIHQHAIKEKQLNQDISMMGEEI